MFLNIYMYLFCFLDKKFYQGSKEETLEFKWGVLYITVDFFPNWQCLGFKQNKVPVNVKFTHKDLRFLLYENRELKFFYAINVHESMKHALFLFRDRMFSCQTPFFPFLGRNMVWSASPGFLLAHTPAQPTRSASQPSLGCDFSWFCSTLHILSLMGGCDMLLWYYSVSVCLYTSALAYRICHLEQQFKGLWRARETMHSGGLCAGDNRPVTCLMKVVRRQICGLAS